MGKLRIAVPAATAQHAVRASRRTCKISRGIKTIRRTEPIIAPLPDITAHIVNA